MKRLTIISAALLFAAASAVATKPAEELRIYINPGHGSWGASDRPMGTVAHGANNASATNAYPDTLNFFESQTNLHKGFGILDKLRSYGLKFDPTLNQDNTNPARRGAALDMRNNIVMSHVKPGPYPHVADNEQYNRSLSEIREEVERNNFDFFISPHSNAVSQTDVNYPLFLFRGEDATVGGKVTRMPEVEGSDLAALALWPYAFKNTHHQWTNYSLTNPNVRGDITFNRDEGTTTYDGKTFRGYYGVLRHGVPGFIVEGFFHTYAPSRHRAMNFDADRMEGVAYARGLADWFGLQKETTGDIYGVVRAEGETFTHTYWPTPLGNDKYRPLNGATVTLLDGDVPIATYTTDEEYNGVFVFRDLEPGTYYVTVSHPTYRTAMRQGPIEVTAAETTYPEVFLAAAGSTEAAFAYGVEVDRTNKKLSFRLNADARVRIELEPVKGGEMQVLTEGAYAKGLNTISYDISGYPEDQYRVKMVTINEPQAAPKLLYEDALIKKAGGVTIDRDPYSLYFGNVYVMDNITSGKHGIYIMNAEREKENTSPYGTATFNSTQSQKRMGMLPSGRVFVTDWSNPNSGIWRIDPRVASKHDPENMFVYSERATSGLLSNYGGTPLGGSTTHAAVYIDKDNGRHMIAYTEDYPDNKLTQYALGNDETIGYVEKIFTEASDLLGNNNAHIVVTDKGFVVSQGRTQGQNTKVFPSIIFTDFDGNILWNSGEHLTANMSSEAVALSPDGKKMAITPYLDSNNTNKSNWLVRLYDVEWEGTNITVTESGTIDFSASNPGRMRQL